MAGFSGAAGAFVVNGAAFAGVVCSVLLTRDCGAPAWLSLTKNAERMLSAQMTMAKVQVAFSTKLLVLRTPIIWFELAKLEASPPPLDF